MGRPRRRPSPGSPRRQGWAELGRAGPGEAWLGWAGLGGRAAPHPHRADGLACQESSVR